MSSPFVRNVFLAWLLACVVGSAMPDPRKPGGEDVSDLEEPDELSDPPDFEDDPADDDSR